MKIPQYIFLILIFKITNFIYSTENIYRVERNKELNLKLIESINSTTLENNSEMRKLLIKAGADINTKDEYGNTALILCCAKNRKETAKLLIKKANKKYKELLPQKYLNTVNMNGETALIIASRNNYIDLVKLLINNKADLGIKDNYKKSALDWCFEKKYEDIADLLIKSGCSIKAHKSIKNNLIEKAITKRQQMEIVKTILFNEIENGDFEKLKDQIKKLIEIGMPATFGIYDQENDNPLHYAIKIKNKKNDPDKNKIIDLILSIRPQLAYEKNNKGKTPIDLIHEDQGAINWIIQKKNIISCNNLDKEKIKKENRENLGTRLINLLKNLNTNNPNYLINYEKIKLLIEIGANLNIKDKYGDTAIKIAISNKNIDIIKLLLERNINYDQSLIEAISQDNKEICKLLIINGCPLNTKNTEGYTALDYAYKRSNYDIAELLIKSGCKLEINYQEGTIFKFINYYLTSNTKNIKMIEMIEEATKKRELIKILKPKIFKLIEANNYEELKDLIKKLIKAQMPVTLGIYDQDGNNPLHYAFNIRDENNNINKHKIIDLILAIRPKLAYEKNNSGQTPIDMIIKNSSPWITEKIKILNNLN